MPSGHRGALGGGHADPFGRAAPHLPRSGTGARADPGALGARAPQGGETKVLATSVLEKQRLPARLFALLYRHRWGVEESYKRQKHLAKIEKLSERSVLAVHQDIHAKILAMNPAAMVRNVGQLVAARRFTHRKFSYQVRACSALSAMKDNPVRLLLAEPEDRHALLETLIRTMSHAVDALRPDRSFPRHTPGRLMPGFHLAYKHTVYVAALSHIYVPAGDLTDGKQADWLAPPFTPSECARGRTCGRRRAGSGRPPTDPAPGRRASA